VVFGLITLVISHPMCRGDGVAPRALHARASAFSGDLTGSRDARVVRDPSATAYSDAPPPAVSARH
jgi:hypothetical protein